jgi:hypothetical protein
VSCRVAAGSTGRRAVIQGRDRVLAGQAVVLQTVMTASAVRVAVSRPGPGIKKITRWPSAQNQRLAGPGAAGYPGWRAAPGGGVGGGNVAGASFGAGPGVAFEGADGGVLVHPGTSQLPDERSPSATDAPLFFPSLTMRSVGGRA